jgi:hypothetical protein
MGIPGPSTKDLEDVEKRFSDDVLKIELSGPEQHHLSVVDVSRLFHSEWNTRPIVTVSNPQDPSKYQTEEDRGIIPKLIEGYIIDKRTIILYCCLVSVI